MTNAPLVLQCYLIQHGLTQSLGQLFLMGGALMYIGVLYQLRQEIIVSVLNCICSVVCLSPITVRVASRQL